jgi:citrate lyase subunit beta/citryl-CoA lyase
MALPCSYLITDPCDQDQVRRALASEADAVVLDLVCERASAPAVRREACYVVSGRPAGRLWARINPLGSGLGADDCRDLVGPGLAGVFLPYVQSAQDLRDLAVVLRQHELGAGVEPGSVLVVAVIETALGVLKLRDIAEASPRLAGLAIDRAALAQDLDGGVEGFGVKYAAGELAVVARAHGLAAVEASAAGAPGQASDLSKVRSDGFSAAVVREAAEAAVANALFDGAGEPDPDLVAAYLEAREQGEELALQGGRFVDAYAARRLRAWAPPSTDLPKGLGT